MEFFEKNVFEFLNHNEKKVLVIKGKWGVGKTFTWAKIVEKYGKDLSLSNYSYVSLFGLEELKELQSGIFYNAHPLNTGTKSSTVKANLKKVSKIAKHIPQISKYTTAMSAIESSLINDYLICIDDLERKSSKLSMSNLLGFVSNLSETSNCKIVLIFNDDTLSDSDKKEIDKYREKVIDLELEYSPNSESNIDIEFKEHPCRGLICDIFKPEALNNIRIIKHIKWNIDGLISYIQNSESAVKHDLLSTIAILTYVHHEPSIEIRANEIDRVFTFLIEKPEEDKKLQKRISALGYMYYADHEAEIVNYIEDGWLNEQRFTDSIVKLNERQKKDNISSKLTDIWGFYNNNFISTGDEVIKGLKGFLNDHMESISIRELQPILETLQEIEDSFDRAEWVDKFVKLQLQNDNASLLKQLKGMTETDELLEEINKREVGLHQHLSIYTVLKEIVKNRGWNPEDEQFLGNHSAEEIYDFLVNDTNEDLMQIVREGMRIFRNADGDEPRYIFGRNLNDALIKISKRSKIDRYRISHFFGVDLPK
ncbi:P-loop NTPase fold protein [Psychromonas sp.]|uniref:P-loop NTPase fold protein n=1 Tax=Psychromonas sp. TaxID=1884585 RepID=UPI00356A8FCE